MHYLDEIYVFSRVAMLGSFSKASKSLNMPVSTVSRKVSTLEKRINAILIQRTTRQLRLTAQGSQFFEQCKFHLQGIEDAKAGLVEANQGPEGPLKISVPVTMGKGSFLDFLSDFLHKYPKIQIELVVTNQYQDLISESIDLAIRFGHLKDSSLIARKLGLSRRILVASHQYLKIHGIPRTPKDLEEHSCLRFQPQGEETKWDLVSDKNKSSIKISGSVSGSDFNTISEFAIRGHGIALLPEAYCLQALKSGELRHIMKGWSSAPTPINLVYSNKKYIPFKLQVFIDSLTKWENPSWR